MAKILTPFVIGVGEHEENILQDWDEELLEEDICSLGISLRHVVDELDAHRESSVLDFSERPSSAPSTEIAGVMTPAP